jgi:Tol biopolymer transport system component
VSRSLAIITVTLVCAVSAGAAASFSDPLYPMISPDGSKLAWVEGATSRIWVASVDGTSAQVFGPSFAADGIGQIAWTRYGMVVDSNFTLFRLSAAGKRTKLSVVGDQWFSVGGTRAAVGSGRRTGPITVVDLLTRKVARVGSPAQFNNEPSLSRDGRRVAWWAGPSGGVWVAPVSSGAARRLVAAGSCPLWSPNGRAIAYLTFGKRGQDLHVIGAAGGPSKLLAARAGGCGTFAWSPDSKTIAFTPQRIATVSVATKRVTRSAGLGRVVGGLAWSHDGSELYAPARPLAAEKALNNCTNLWRLDTKSLTGRVIVRGCP